MRSSCGCYRTRRRAGSEGEIHNHLTIVIQLPSNEGLQSFDGVHLYLGDLTPENALLHSGSRIDN